MLAAALVTLKLHRFEVAIALLAALAATTLGVSIALRIDGLHVSQACLGQVLASQDDSGLDAGCFALVQNGTGIIGETYLTGEGTLPLSVMGALPFLLGLLGGVPLVARELEAGTAQTAWSLNPSRMRWLGHQIAPVAVLLGAVVILAALVAMPKSPTSGSNGASVAGRRSSVFRERWWWCAPSPPSGSASPSGRYWDARCRPSSSASRCVWRSSMPPDRCARRG